MKTHRKKEWFDNDAFWRDLYPLLASRFSDVKLYGNLDGEEYGLNAQRLIAVGRRGSP